MNARTLYSVAMLVALSLAQVGARAAEEKYDWMADARGCHALLTDSECAKHRDSLAALPNLAARYAYLSEQGIALQEREAMCSCKRMPPSAGSRKLQLARR